MLLEATERLREHYSHSQRAARPSHQRCRKRVSPPAGRFDSSRARFARGLEPKVGARPSRRLALLKGSHFPAGRNARADWRLLVKTVKLYQSCLRVRV